MPKNQYVAPIAIQVEIESKPYFGTYTISSGIVKVEWDGFVTSSQSGANAVATAKQLLRELVRKNQI